MNIEIGVAIGYCHYAFFGFTYKFKLLAIKLSQTYLSDKHLFWSQLVSTILKHKPKIPQTTKKNHLLSIFLPHFLQISIQITTWKQKPNMLTLPGKNLPIFTYVIKWITMSLLLLCSASFLPWHLSFSDSLHRERVLPMVWMKVRKKALSLLISHHWVVDPLGRLHIWIALSCSMENPYLTCNTKNQKEFRKIQLQKVMVPFI